jgi:hypothetical protein
MGSDAEVFIFDYDAYRREVVPAFVDVFRQGHVAKWLEPFLKRRELNPALWNRNDLSRYADSLDPDLSWRGPYDLEWTYDDDWQHRWSTSNENSAPPDELAESINWLFKIAVSIKCLGASQFVGRSRTVTHFSNTLSELQVKEDYRIVELLAALGKRGFLIGYQFGFGSEGINGWLDAAETADLASRLDRLPLEESILWVVPTTAKCAVEENRGLLWGNDVMPADFYRER